ncbi:SpoIIE family protein phosphatase [Bernardetia sp. ABR2-2B]|uniref:SpoIIE family protein phosphatase n=1 Tax=Bernardetia sp. ABR2-2B TaxID=3127472 RepID=UPI0030CAD6EF
MNLAKYLEAFKAHVPESSLSEEQGKELSQLIKKVEREIKMANFKYERTAKEKKSLEKLLEQTIKELETKNENLAETNAQLSSMEEELRQNSEELLILNERLEERVEKAVSNIENQKELLEVKNKHILDSINYAKRIQRAMLLSEKEVASIFPNSFIFFSPKDIVSGDFYWLAKVEEYRFVAVIDCTGHGVPGAFMSLILNDGLNEIVKLRKIVEPAKVLEELNIYVISALRQKGSANRDGADMSLCVIDDKQNTLTFAGARQNLVFCRDNELIEVKANRKSIGGYIKNKDTQKFVSHVINLDSYKDYYFYLSSDGFADQFGGQSGGKLLRQNFKKKLQEICKKECNRQYKELKKHFQDWKGKQEQIDDVLVIGFKP